MHVTFFGPGVRRQGTRTVPTRIVFSLLLWLCCFLVRLEVSESLVPLTQFSKSLTFFADTTTTTTNHEHGPTGEGCIDHAGYFYDRPEAEGGSSTTRYELGIVEEHEVATLAKFIVTGFGAEVITLAKEMSSFEKLLLDPAAQLLNGYSGVVAFAEVYTGTQQRIAQRLETMTTQSNNNNDAIIAAPQLQGLASHDARIRTAERDSLVLILAKTNDDNNNARQDTAATTEIIASIELRLQPCDAKIPFSIPWLDRLERRFWKLATQREDLQPYLSNLCVADDYRGRQIGRSLVRCVEDIAHTHWGYQRMYLHVDEVNRPALHLYQSAGYTDVGHRWNPFWAGSVAPKIGYYVKAL